MNWPKIKKWLIGVAIVYIVIGAAIYFFQDLVLFRPVSLKRDHKYEFTAPHTDIDLPINKNDTLNLVLFHNTATVRKGIVIYFHGNRKNISWYARFAPKFTSNGYEVVMIDYPGYGKSLGKFDEQTLYDWSRIVYTYAKSRFSEDSIIIYGKSMGTGIATNLAMNQPSKRVILETPYYDLPSVMKQFLPIYPMDWLIHYKMKNHRFIVHIKQPVSIFHGTDDGVIFYRNAKRLLPSLKAGDEFITIDGGHHNDLYEFPLMNRKIDSLLQAP